MHAIGKEDHRRLLKEAKSALKAGEYDETLRRAREVLQADRGNYHAWVLVGAAAAGRGERQRALQAYERAIQVNEREALAWRGILEAVKDETSVSDARELRLALRACEVLLPAVDDIDGRRRVRERQMQLCRALVDSVGKADGITAEDVQAVTWQAEWDGENVNAALLSVWEAMAACAHLMVPQACQSMVQVVDAAGEAGNALSEEVRRRLQQIKWLALRRWSVAEQLVPHLQAEVQRGDAPAMAALLRLLEEDAEVPLTDTERLRLALRLLHLCPYDPQATATARAIWSAHLRFHLRRVNLVTDVDTSGASVANDLLAIGIRLERQEWSTVVSMAPRATARIANRASPLAAYRCALAALELAQGVARFHLGEWMAAAASLHDAATKLRAVRSAATHVMTRVDPLLQWALRWTAQTYHAMSAAGGEEDVKARSGAQAALQELLQIDPGDVWAIVHHIEWEDASRSQGECDSQRHLSQLEAMAARRTAATPTTTDARSCSTPLELLLLGAERTLGSPCRIQAELWLALGRHRQHGRESSAADDTAMDSACDALVRAIEADPYFAEAHVVLGQALLQRSHVRDHHPWSNLNATSAEAGQQRQYRIAIRCLEHGRELERGHPVACRLLLQEYGRMRAAYSMVGDYRAVQSVLQRAERLCLEAVGASARMLPWAWLALGNVYMDWHRYADATSALQTCLRALEGEPVAEMVYARLWYWLGIAYRQQGKVVSACRALEKSWAFWRQHWNASSWNTTSFLSGMRVAVALAPILAQLGRAAEGIAALEWVKSQMRTVEAGEASGHLEDEQDDVCSVTWRRVEAWLLTALAQVHAIHAESLSDLGQRRASLTAYAAETRALLRAQRCLPESAALLECIALSLLRRALQRRGFGDEEDNEKRQQVHTACAVTDRLFIEASEWLGRWHEATANPVARAYQAMVQFLQADNNCDHTIPRPSPRVALQTIRDTARQLPPTERRPLWHFLCAALASAGALNAVDVAELGLLDEGGAQRSPDVVRILALTLLFGKPDGRHAEQTHAAATMRALRWLEAHHDAAVDGSAVMGLVLECALGRMIEARRYYEMAVTHRHPDAFAAFHAARTYLQTCTTEGAADDMATAAAHLSLWDRALPCVVGERENAGTALAPGIGAETLPATLCQYARQLQMEMAARRQRAASSQERACQSDREWLEYVHRFPDLARDTQRLQQLRDPM
ncbi:hypothetical protein CDCA_CDCA01G0347 [Cyanidium caldarium]|uniref:Uncharacterized protein n=1 Tax=Cyanidium caldarium TaxID=2771 RepID=A0AAV9IQ13_CYACA|nr:hypothetical protein CDCA_CDCA01G0347 [Cyanidium caldarium]